MHRKSAYFLFLAVLAMLVIGIVMLFSTSAFARDAHGDVYFFIKRQAVWLGIGLAVLIAAALVDYHFWQRTWWIWFVLALGALALCFVPHFGHAHQRLAPLGRRRSDHISAIGNRQDRRSIFSGLVVRAF